MKLRKFEFLKFDITEKLADGQEVKRTEIDYRATAKDVIVSVNPNSGGMSTDEVIKSVMAYGKIAEAFEKKKDYALLDETSWQYLKEKTNSFKWGISHQRVVDFILYVRNLPEVEVDEAAK